MGIKCEARYLDPVKQSCFASWGAPSFRERCTVYVDCFIFGAMDSGKKTRHDTKEKELGSILAFHDVE